MARIFTLWSGGLDSTYLLQKLSEEGHEVDCGYIQINNHTNKTKRELIAIGNIIDSNFLKDLNVVYRGVVGSYDMNFSNHIFLQQVPVFLFGIIDNIKDRYDKVAMGYVMGDDAISFLSDIKTIYRSFNKISHKPLPELIFPLSKIPKPFIYEKLKKDVRRLVTWCESPGDTDICGSCIPCKKMIFHGLYDDFNRGVLPLVKIDVNENKGSDYEY